jgi:NADH-quinone oxidoreductase subunit L
LHHAHDAPLWVKLAPLVVGIAGIALAWLFYIRQPDLPGKTAATFRPVYLFFYNKWYFDELYDFLFVRPSKRIGHWLWKKGDGALIDGLGPDGLAEGTRGIARFAGRLQSGYIYHYAFVMLIGVVVLASVAIIALLTVGAR